MSLKFNHWYVGVFLLFGLLSTTQSLAFKSNLERPINGAEGTDARIQEGSELFSANCASCHALNNKVVGPALAGLVDKYDEDYEWMIAWIKNNQKLVKAGDERALKIYNEYNGAAMNIFENLSDDQITSVLMWIDNKGDGTAPVTEDIGGGGAAPAPVSDSLFNSINWFVVIMGLLVFVIILMILGILELVSNVTGREVINWNNINAYMMILFMVGFFALVIYEYNIHYDRLLMAIPAASEHGVELDRMMRWTFAATIPVFFITQFLLFYFSFRYRQKPGRKAYFLSHNNNLEYVWTLIPAVVLTVLVSGGFKMWNKILRSDASKNSTKIEVFAYQFGWNARYPGEDNKLGLANYNLINGVNPLGVANRTHAQELIIELKEEIKTIEETITKIPRELGKLKSTLGGREGDDRKDHLKRIASYENGEIEDDLRLTIRARNTQIERLVKALEAEKGMFTGTGDDDQVVQEIHLIKGQPVTLKFRARDVIHSAYLPYFRTQMNVVPGLPTEFTFTPTVSTEEMRAIKNDPEFNYNLVCNKICGNAHFNMKMKVVVEDEDSYEEWLNEQGGLFVKKEETREDAETEVTSEESTETVALN